MSGESTPRHELPPVDPVMDHLLQLIDARINRRMDALIRQIREIAREEAGTALDAYVDSLTVLGGS